MEQINYSEKKVVIFEDNKTWSDALFLWCRHFGFKDITCFNTKDDYLDYITIASHIDICIVNFYSKHKSNQELIKMTRENHPDTLIFAISADFITDNDVLDTKEMIKAIYAGANRATIKDIRHIKQLIDEHLKIRTLTNWKDIKVDPKRFIKSINMCERD